MIVIRCRASAALAKNLIITTIILINHRHDHHHLHSHQLVSLSPSLFWSTSSSRWWSWFRSLTEFGNGKTSILPRFFLPKFLSPTSFWFSSLHFFHIFQTTITAAVSSIFIELGVRLLHTANHKHSLLFGQCWCWWCSFHFCVTLEMTF